MNPSPRRRLVGPLVAVFVAAVGCAPAEPKGPAVEGGAPPPGAAAAAPASRSSLDFPTAAGAPAGLTPPGCAALPPETGPQLALQLARLETLRDLVFSNDGALLATTGMMRSKQIWDARTAQLRLVLDAPGNSEALVFDPSSTWAAAIDGNAVVAWQLETGRRRVLFEAPGAYEVAIAPDGRSVATTQKGSVRTWSLEGRPLATMAIGVERAAYAPDGTRIVTWERSVFVDKTITVWDAATGAKLWSRSGSTGSAGGSAAWSPDGSELAWIPEGREVELLDARTGKARRKLSGGSELEEVAYAGSPADPRVVARDSHDERGKVLVWEAASGRRVASHGVPGVRGIVVSRDGKRVVAQTRFDAAWAIDPSSAQPPVEVIRDANEIWQFAAHPSDKRVAVTGHGRAPVVIDQVDGKATKGVLPIFDVVTMALGGGGTTLATIQTSYREWDSAVRLWDARTGVLRGSLEPPPSRDAKERPPVYTHVAASPAGDRYVTTLMGRVDLFSEGGRFERTVEAFPKFRTEMPVAFSRDGRRLAVAGGPRDTVRIYDPKVGIVSEHEGRIGRIVSLAFSPDRTRIAVGATGKVAILDVASGAEIAMLKGDFRRVEAIAWRDERTLFTANETGSVARATIGGGVETFAAHGARARDVAISPDGKLVATSGEDRALRVWNADTMQPVATTTFPESAARSAVFHPTLPLVFAAGSAVRAMRVPDGAALSLYMVRAGRDLAGLAVSAGGLFSGDEKAFAAIRFAPGQARARAPLAWFDTQPALRRPALIDDLARGCPMARPGQAAP
jgi:WD40 repeat protein